MNYLDKNGLSHLWTRIKSFIPTKLSQLTADSTHRTVTDTEKTTWNNKSNFSGSYNDLSGKPTLATVATSGSYADLSNKPTAATIGAVATNDIKGNATGHIYLTGAKESSSTGSTSQIVFGTSSNNHVAISSNKNAIVINPTTGSTTNQIVMYLDKKSQFPSGIDAGSLSEGGVALSSKYAAKANVPTKTSQLTNDSGFITTETDPSVPSWAKASSKPSYTKSEVGLGNVDNVKQYSSSNPPPYPVTSVNGQTGAVTINVPTITSGTTDLEAGVSPLATGTIYIVYE